MLHRICLIEQTGNVKGTQYFEVYVCWDRWVVKHCLLMVGSLVINAFLY